MKPIHLPLAGALYFSLSSSSQFHALSFSLFLQLQPKSTCASQLAGPESIDVLIFMYEVVLNLDVKVQFSIVDFEQAILSGKMWTFWGWWGRMHLMERVRYIYD
jgi:hypothetical protein